MKYDDYNIHGNIINFPNKNRGPYLSEIIEKIQEEPEKLKNKEEIGFFLRAPDIGKASRKIKIKVISVDAFDEVYENPDILIIKEDEK